MVASSEPTLRDFMTELHVEEPDWIHVTTHETVVPDPLDTEAVKQAIIDNLTQIHDPEIPINIYDLGLIYDISVSEDGRAAILMTLTAPNCPVAGSLPQLVEKGAGLVPGVSEAKVELTWTPAWTIERASEDARFALDM
ncbi:iron-sulfur cluster assembly protein [Fodinicurvata sp. EGI_FJ10296]|uniref:iron-sulfur cluster assembly protein n=1 Tax=Fodinicurvata sp. EGI_FJ10296 TaxID=3231908 RepID=UPI00345300C2